MSEKTIGTKPRIEYIDLAKGFCIILVVCFHLSLFYGMILPGTIFMKAFRMPLYFFLSGCFFKAYEGFWGFFKRKVNKLLIPFFFFYFLTSVGLPHVQVHLLGIDTNLLHMDKIFTAFLSETYPNQPIWFLLCLFEESIVFYVLYLLAQKYEDKSNLIICAGSLMIGFIGILLGLFSVNLPATLDTAFSSMPFFAGGYYVFRKTDILKPNKYDKYLPYFIIVSFSLVAIICNTLLIDSSQFYSFIKNTFTLKAALIFYPYGFVGIFGVILLAKLLKKIPLISYFGRYSIMILVTHWVVFDFIAAVLNHLRLNLPIGYIFMINLILTMLSYVIIIPFMRKFMPHVTAQKDVIPIGK